MTQPLTTRADTPREAVEEVCKWLEAMRDQRNRQSSALKGTQALEAFTIAASLATLVVCLKHATIEPKSEPEPDPEDESAWVEKPVRGSWRY